MDRPGPRPLLPPILPVDPFRPLHWLRQGFQDLRRNPGLSLAHGLLTAGVGWLITWVAYDRFWILAGLISAFMVCAPVLATSLYAMSRAIERGEAVDAGLLIRTWSRWQWKLQAQPESYWSLIRFGLLLALSAAGWVVTSSAFIWLTTTVPIHTPVDFVRHIMGGREHRLFEIWMALGGVMAAPVFASSVVSMPLLLDRRVTVLEAVLTSWKVVLSCPVTMAFWAFLLMTCTLLGLVSLYLGLILVVPVLGHASWHAYRDLVDVRGLPPRLGEDEGSP